MPYAADAAATPIAARFIFLYAYFLAFAAATLSAFLMLRFSSRFAFRYYFLFAAADISMMLRIDYIELIFSLIRCRCFAIHLPLLRCFRCRCCYCH